MDTVRVHQLRLVGHALAAASCPVCAHVGQVVGQLIAQPEPCVRLVHAYVRAELCENSPSLPTAAITRLAWLMGATVAPVDATSERLDADWFATLVGPEASADRWTQAFGAYPTLGAYRGAYETLALAEPERAALWMLLAERRAHQPPEGTDVWTDAATDKPDTLRYVGEWPVKPFTLTVARHGLAGCTTTYRIYFVRLPRTLVRSVVGPLYCAISAGEGDGLLQWVTPDECSFVTTLHPLWTRRAGIVRGTDCVHDEWDGFDWTLAPKQMHLEQISPLCTTLWDTLEAWQGPGAPAWNYATLLEYAPTFADKDSEDTYQPLASVVLADDSLVVCVNLSPQPLHLRLRRYRGDATTSPHRSTLGQGDAFVVPQAMIPMLEVAVSDPALAEATDGAGAVEETGAMLMMLHSAHTFTHYTRAEVHTILHDQLSSSSPDTDADTTAVALAPSPAQRGRDTVNAGAGAGAAGAKTGNDASEPQQPHPSPALGIKTVVHASPHVCQLQGRARGRPRARSIVRLPIVHQLVGVHGRRFARNPKTKHWFAIVRTVDTTTGSVRVDYVNEEAFDDIDQPSDLLFPVDDTMLVELERFVADDPTYAHVWRLVRDHVAQVRTLEEATQRAASPPSPSPTRLPRTIRTSPCKASPPPSMRPVHATADQWRIQPQSTTMGDGLWVVRAPTHTLFEYTVHTCDVDHLVTLEAVDDALDTCAIVVRSAPDATTNVLAPRGSARGPGSYANAVDYRWDAAAGELVYVPEGEERTHQANAELLEYDGKVYLRLTEALEGAYAMVEYGETYRGGGCL